MEPSAAPRTPLDCLLARHSAEVPSSLSSWRRRSDLLSLELHLLHAPFLTLTFLLSTASPLSCLLHRLHAVHGPFNGLRLFRCGEESEDDELTDLSLTLDELGCRGGNAAADDEPPMHAATATGGTATAARRRYELWYSLLSSLDGALLMREPRQYVSDEQLSEAMQDDELRSGDEDGETRHAPSIVVTADDSAEHSAPQPHLNSGRLQAAVVRVSAPTRLGRVVEVAVDQHTSRQRVEQSKELISEAFSVDAEAARQQPVPTAQPLHSGRHSGGYVTADAKSEEEKQSQAAAEAAQSLALTYS